MKVDCEDLFIKWSLPSINLWFSFFHVAFVPFQTTSFGLLPIDVWLGVPQLLKILLAQPMEWVENRLSLHIFELRNPSSDVIAIRIVPLSLTDGVEDGITWFPTLKKLDYLQSTVKAENLPAYYCSNPNQPTSQQNTSPPSCNQ